MKITKDQIEALKTQHGGWTRESLAALGVSWPPKKGWKRRLLERYAPEPNETTEMWREWHEHQRQQRESRRVQGTEDIRRILDDGYEVIGLTEFQFRVNDAVDLYPTRRRYHVLATGQRGRYGNVREFVRRTLGPVNTETVHAPSPDQRTPDALRRAPR